MPMYRKPFFCRICLRNRWPGDCGHTQFEAPDPEVIEAIRSEDPRAHLEEILPGKLPSQGDVYIADSAMLGMMHIRTAFKVELVEIDSHKDFVVYVSPFDDAPSTPPTPSIPFAIRMKRWLEMAAHFRFCKTVRACHVYGCRGNATGFPLFGHEHCHEARDKIGDVVEAPSSYLVGPKNPIKLAAVFEARPKRRRGYIISFEKKTVPGRHYTTLSIRVGATLYPDRLLIPSSVGFDFKVLGIQVNGVYRCDWRKDSEQLPVSVFFENVAGVNLPLGRVDKGEEISILLFNVSESPRDIAAALIGQTDDDDKADEEDQRKEDEEEDALEGDDDADLDEDDAEDEELDEDDPDPLAPDKEDEDLDKDDEDEDEDTDPDLVLSGPVGACCPHRLGVHDKITTACNACGCNGFVFPEDHVIGSEAKNDAAVVAEAEACALSLRGSSPRLEKALLRAVPDLGPIVGDCEDLGPISPLFAEALRLAKIRRQLGDRSPALRAMPKVKKRFPLPFPSVDIPPHTFANVTVRPQIACLLRRLVCEAVPELVVMDLKIGKNSMVLAYGDGMPLSAFPAFPPELEEAAIEAIERSGFWENIPQEVAQVSMDVTISLRNTGNQIRTFRGLVLTDAIDC